MGDLGLTLFFRHVFKIIFGFNLVSNAFVYSKSDCQNQTKKVPPTPNSVPMDKSRGSWTAAPKVKDFPTNKQQLKNKQQQLNNSTKTPTSTELLLQFDCCRFCFLSDCCYCCCVFFDFEVFLNGVDLTCSIVMTFPVRFSKSLLSEPPWARPCEFLVALHTGCPKPCRPIANMHSYHFIVSYAT